jgi:hypothetical protein
MKFLQPTFMFGLAVILGSISTVTYIYAQKANSIEPIAPWPSCCKDSQGDYYAPGPTVVVPATRGQLKKNEQGDYYVGDKMILNKRRAEALKTCTHLKAFESDAYVACMSKEGEAP